MASGFITTSINDMRQEHSNFRYALCKNIASISNPFGLVFTSLDGFSFQRLRAIKNPRASKGEFLPKDDEIPNNH